MEKKATGVDFAAQAEKYLGVSYREMDCQALMERLLKDAGIRKDWTGSNAMARDMAWLGTIGECVERYGQVPPGAWLYIWQEKGAPDRYRDGLGNFSHVGVRTEKGVIHSSKSKGAVVFAPFREEKITGGWNRVGLCGLLDYGLSEEAEDKPEAWAVVTAESGTTVNLRAGPGKHARLVERVPLGNRVRVLTRGEEWHRVQWDRRKGYLMVVFLKEE